MFAWCLLETETDLAYLVLILKADEKSRVNKTNGGRENEDVRISGVMRKVFDHAGACSGERHNQSGITGTG